MFLLTICAAMTSLITEAVKKMAESKKPTIIAAIVSVVVGIAVPVGYMILNHVEVSSQNIVYVVAMAVLTWLCSTLGYDTVKTAIGQIVGK